jgi:hypothetical protein
MFNSAAEEILHWAGRCRTWARGARSHEQRLMLQSLERLLGQAALDVDEDIDYLARPLARTNS